MNQGDSIMSDTDTFFQISAVLTGFDDLSPVLAEPFFTRLSAVFPQEMAKIIAIFGQLPGVDLEKEMTEKVMNDPAAKDVLPLVKEIINCWMLGSFYLPTPDRTHMPPTAIAQYEGQKMFPLILAPVRGYSSLPHGFWKDKPAGQ